MPEGLKNLKPISAQNLSLRTQKINLCVTGRKWRKSKLFFGEVRERDYNPEWRTKA
jgi:hypothetical protein